MIIPTKVKIGSTTYEVRIANTWFEHDGSDGETFYDNNIGNVIYINEALSEEAKGETFIHEVMHCMNSTMNHEFLDSLSNQMYSFLIENKLLK